MLWGASPQGKLLEDSSEKMNSINLLKHMTPIAAIVLMVMVVFLEPDITDSIPRYDSPAFASFASIMLLNGLLSFLVNLSNFLVTNYTSPLTLQVRTQSPEPYVPSPSTSTSYALNPQMLAHRVRAARILSMLRGLWASVLTCAPFSPPFRCWAT